MAFVIPDTTQNITYRALLNALDEIGTGVLRMQSELADGPSASLPSGFQDQDEIDDLTKNLNLAGYPKGTYFVKVLTDQHAATNKLVLQ